MPANLRQLTAFRALAAAWVVLYHYWPDLFGPARPPALVARGYLGVEAFFVLSGFILCHVYLREAEAGRLRFGDFLWARIARIYPTHLFTLAWIGAMALAAAMLGRAPEHAVADWPSLPANLTLTQAWGLAPRAAWNHPSWSISAEWAAYLLFPVFAWSAVRLRARPVWTVTGALVLLAASYAGFARLAGFPLTAATIDWGALRILPPFAYGCALHGLWRAGALSGRREAGLAAVLFALLTVLSAAAGAPDTATVASAGALVLALAALARDGSGVLASRAWVFAGEASFALYMVAIPWRAALAGLAGRFVDLPDGRAWPPALAAALVAGSAACAALTHLLVERPARVRLRELARRRPFRPLEEKGRRDDSPRRTA